MANLWDALAAAVQEEEDEGLQILRAVARAEENVAPRFKAFSGKAFRLGDSVSGSSWALGGDVEWGRGASDGHQLARREFPTIKEVRDRSKAMS